MHSNNKTWIVPTTIIIILILITYMQTTIYIPFKNVVKIEKMVEQTSEVKITNVNTHKIIYVSSEGLKVKLHNLFNDLKIRRIFFISKSKITLPSYVIELKYISSNNADSMYIITILDNGNINIDGEMYTMTNNIYNQIQEIMATQN